MPIGELEQIVLPDGRNLKDINERVIERVDASAKAQDSYFRRCDHFFGLYRQHKQLRDHYAPGAENDRDEGLLDAKKVFGSELFIPYVFATVETMVARMLGQLPKMLIIPGDQAAAKNVRRMKGLIERQERRAAYPLTMQEIAKQGCIYGLGVQKTGWDKRVVKSKELVPAEVPTEEVQWVEQEVEKPVYDDPNAWWVNIFDFFWDPYGHDIPSCRYLVHRLYRDTEYVVAKLKSGAWGNPAGLTPVDIEEMGGSANRWISRTQDQLALAGQPDYAPPTEDNSRHEILECHDTVTGEVITTLDRQVPMHLAANPYWHREPCFEIFRPTTAAIAQLPGIGEIEPVEDLQHEINALRGQRRDNAALKLMQVFAANQGFVDVDEIEFFPGAILGVNGDPREMLMPINIGDIPNSGYNEEAALKADFERTSGLSDTVMGAAASSTTATGEQLVQMAANVRVAAKTVRCEIEVGEPTVRKWVSMNQQMILDREFYVPAEPTALEPQREWAKVQLTPAELAGNFIVLSKYGSSAPENIVQERADAMTLSQFRGDFNINQRVLYVEILDRLGVTNPERLLTPSNHVPPITLDILVDDMGVPQEMVEEALMMGFQFERAQESGEIAPPAAPDEQAGEPETTRTDIVRGENGRVSGAVTRKE
jgi:hypothetical protein